MSESSVSSSSYSAKKCHKKPQEKKINHQARFVKESFGDRFPVYSDQAFTKTWTFRNTGDFEWPEDTMFIQTNGDEFNATPKKIAGPIKVNQEIDVTI
jgi:hypothetical protein